MFWFFDWERESPGKNSMRLCAFSLCYQVKKTPSERFSNSLGSLKTRRNGHSSDKPLVKSETHSEISPLLRSPLSPSVRLISLTLSLCSNLDHRDRGSSAHFKKKILINRYLQFYSLCFPFARIRFRCLFNYSISFIFFFSSLSAEIDKGKCKPYDFDFFFCLSSSSMRRCFESLQAHYSIKPNTCHLNIHIYFRICR